MSDDELLEVFDAEGRPKGVAKTRAAIHRDGDWHLAFFCWIFREGGDAREGLEVVLQKRAATKDVWPGRFDASAAGHVRFGETMEDASREIEEELGIRPEARELVLVMRHAQEHVHESGLVDRELHDVHVLRWAAPLEEYRPGPEVSGLVAVPVRSFLELASGARESLATELVTFDDTGRARREALVLRSGDLVPYDAAYHARIAAAADVYSGRASMARR